MLLSEIAKIINAKMIGKDIDIKNLSDLDNQYENSLGFAENKKSFEILNNSIVSAIIYNEEIKTDKSLLVVNNPKEEFRKLLKLFSPYKEYEKKIYPNVYIENTVKLGKNITILPFTSIMDNAEIGDNTVIYSNVFIGKNVKIGKNCIIKAGVKIDDETIIGDNVIIHHNSVIGGDGFGYDKDNDGRNIKIPQIGRIIIEDDVEIGACVTVDRATIGETRISKGVKIDNLVQIAHNVKIGENSIIVSQVGIAGSSKIGKNCILAGQVGIADHCEIGDNVIVLAKSGVDNKKIEDNQILMGIPARAAMEHKRSLAVFSKLPEMNKTLNEIKKRLNME